MIDIVVSVPFSSSDALKSLKITLRSIERHIKFDYKLHVVGKMTGYINKDEANVYSVYIDDSLVDLETYPFSLHSIVLNKISNTLLGNFLFIPCGTIFMKDIYDTNIFTLPNVCNKKCELNFLTHESTVSIVKYVFEKTPARISQYGCYMFNGREISRLNYKYFFSNGLYNHNIVYFSVTNKTKKQKKVKINELKQYGFNSEEEERNLLLLIDNYSNIDTLYISPALHQNKDYSIPHDYKYFDKSRFEL